MKNPQFMVLLVVLTTGIIILNGCNKNTTDAINVPTESLKGITFTPKSFQPADFTRFFEKAKQAGNIISWAGDWNELVTENGGPNVVAELSSKYKYTPVIEAQFFTQSTGKLLRPLDESAQQAYKDSAVAFAERYKPKYLALGIEVNVLYEKSPVDFDKFVQLYNEIYDTVKAKSPNTKVFTIFQLEKMKGLNGGLFGGKNDPAKAQWPLLDKFKTDVIAFTTYPGLIYKDPSDIPRDYYSEIKSYTTKPVAFTEVGWHSASSPQGWESRESEQAEFVVVFFDIAKDLRKEFAIWSFMYDQNTIEPFNSMGLYNNNGSAKQAWDAWVNAR